MNSRKRIIAALERRQPDRVPLVEWVVDRRVMEAILPGCDVYSFNDWIGLDCAGPNKSSWQRDNVESSVRPENYLAMVEALREFGEYPIEA